MGPQAAGARQNLAELLCSPSTAGNRRSSKTYHECASQFRALDLAALEHDVHTKAKRALADGTEALPVKRTIRLAGGRWCCFSHQKPKWTRISHSRWKRKVSSGLGRTARWSGCVKVVCLGGVGSLGEDMLLLEERLGREG
jgi:hypothetical protein